MARLARKGILEHFRAVLDLEWIAYAWAKMDGPSELDNAVPLCIQYPRAAAGKTESLN
ncbi:unnamed protein product [Prunus brigantina]